MHPVVGYVNGNGVWVVYNEDGTEEFHMTYKNGKRVRD